MIAALRSLPRALRSQPAVADAEHPESWQLVAALSDLPPGTLLSATAPDGERVCVYNYRGRIGAVSDVCTHQEFAMSAGTLLPDGSIECAWHGAVFDPATGAVQRGPAIESLPLYAVKVEDGNVYVGGRR